MIRRFSVLGVILVCSVFLLILLVSHRLVTSTSFENSSLNSFGRTIQSWSLGNEINDKSDGSDFFNIFEDNITAEIINVISEQRKLIAQEMTGYKYPHGRYNIAAK